MMGLNAVDCRCCSADNRSSGSGNDDLLAGNHVAVHYIIGINSFVGRQRRSLKKFPMDLSCCFNHCHTAAGHTVFNDNPASALQTGRFHVPFYNQFVFGLYYHAASHISPHPDTSVKAQIAGGYGHFIDYQKGLYCNFIIFQFNFAGFPGDISLFILRKQKAPAFEHLLFLAALGRKLCSVHGSSADSRLRLMVHGNHLACLYLLKIHGILIINGAVFADCRNLGNSRSEKEFVITVPSTLRSGALSRQKPFRSLLRLF